MKIIIFGYDRFESMTTSMMLEAEDIEHTVFCYTEEDKQKFIKGGRVKPERLLVTNKPVGLSYNRNYALDLMKEGEWALFLVDDLIKVTELDEYDDILTENLYLDISQSTEYTRKFNTKISLKKFLTRCEESIRYAERFNCNLIGFAGYDNPFFRANKWKFNIIADGRAWLVRKTQLRFDENVKLIDDVCWTTLNLKEFGVVIINQWVLPKCSRYTKGGYGSIEQRLPQRISEAEYLTKTYPQFIKYRDKKGWPPKSHIVLRNFTPKNS